MGILSWLFGGGSVDKNQWRNLGSREQKARENLGSQLGQGSGRRLCVNVNEAVLEGRKAARVSDYQLALYYCDEALRLNPKLPKLWCNKGATLLALGQYKDAIRCFDKTIALKERYADAWYNKGTAYLKMDQPEEAIKYFDRALEIEPKNGKAWYNKGVALERLEQTEKHHKEAEECFEKAYKWERSLAKPETATNKFAKLAKK